MSRRHPNVVNLSEIEPMTRTKGARFGLTNKRLGGAAGANGLGCSWYEVPPGRAAFPAHWHCANEEAIFVLEGKGTLRIGADSVEVSAGDFAALPPGPDHAHSLVNTGDGPLRYLCMSTMHRAEVVGYPDSNKIAALAWPATGALGPGVEMWVAKWYPAGADVDYYDGEDVD